MHNNFTVITMLRYIGLSGFCLAYLQRKCATGNLTITQLQSEVCLHVPLQYYKRLTSRSFHTDLHVHLLTGQQPQQAVHSPLYSKISWDHGWYLASLWACDKDVLSPPVSTWMLWATSNAGTWQTSCKETAHATKEKWHMWIIDLKPHGKVLDFLVMVLSLRLARSSALSLPSPVPKLKFREC
jgi:hypothetical protein